ncbi:hypothetical protein ACFE04_011961 [Oxalis oulophora]
MAAIQNSLISLPPTVSNTTSATQPPLQKTLNLTSSFTFPSFKLTLTKTPIRRRNGTITMSGSAAGSYATAIAEVAKSNNTLEATSSDLEKIETLFSDPEVARYFNNPTILKSTKLQLLQEIAKSSSLQPHTLNFLSVLIDAKRINIVNEIVKEFETVYNRFTSTEIAVVSSVVKLESTHLAQIAKQVQKLTGAKNVRIKSVIDPSLVAGFTIRYGSSGSKFIDMSVKKQLEEIAAQLDLGDVQLAV